MAKSPTRRRARRQPRPKRRVAAPTAPSSLTQALRDVCADLANARVRYALVGGLAVSARAEPRLTRDVDVAVAVADDAEAEAVLHRLIAMGYRVVAMVEQTRRGRLATARLSSATSPDVVVDLLFASCGIEPEIVASSEPVEILPELRVPVARVGHLIAMKLLASDARRRPQDADDLIALVAIASVNERRRVSTAIRAITRRGFARGRDLTSAWRRVLARDRAG